MSTAHRIAVIIVAGPAGLTAGSRGGFEGATLPRVATIYGLQGASVTSNAIRSPISR